MRNIRTIAAVGIAAAALLSLTACTPASKEEQAIEQLEKFIAATNGDGDFNYCEDMATPDFATAEHVPSRINDGAEPAVEVAPNGVEDRVDVRVVASPTDGPDTSYPSSLWVRFPDNGGPCIMGGIGFNR